MTSRAGKFSLIDVAVESVMTKNVKTIEADDLLVSCVKIMNEADIGSAIVLENGVPIGIFTERDLIRKIARSRDNVSLPMREVMSKPLTVISPKATIWDAISLMGKLNIRRLPVVENGTLVGILTESDVLRLILSQQSLLLESVSESFPAATKEQLKTITTHFRMEKPPSRMEDS